MRVSVVGDRSDGGGRVRRTWQLTAPAMDGPEIPCMGAILLARRLARGEVFQSGAFPGSKDAGRRSVFTRSRGENIIVSRLAISTPLPKIAAWGILSVKSLMTGSIGNLRLKQSKINDEARGIRRWGPAQAREGR